MQAPLLSELHPRFIRERNYIDNVSPKTILFLKQSWGSFQRLLPETKTVEDLQGVVARGEFVITLRQSGVKPVTCNTYIRGVNCFLSWLHKNGLIEARIAIKQLRVEKRVPPTLDGSALTSLIAYKPKTSGGRRVHAIAMTIIDTGARIDELITLRVENVDMDRMVLRLMGKGRKERMMPFSPQLRRVLFRFFGDRQTGLAFPTKDGGMLGYRNLLRDYHAMLNRIGVKNVGGFHRLRHTYATEYIRNSDNAFYLQRMLGHADIKTTSIYVHAATEDLRGGSILSRRAGMRG